jgi:amino acid transporter
MDISNFIFMILVGGYCLLVVFICLVFGLLGLRAKDQKEKKSLQKAFIPASIIVIIILVSIINSEVSTFAANNYIVKVANDIIKMDTISIKKYVEMNNWKLHRNRFEKNYKLTTVSFPLRLIFEKQMQEFTGYVYYNIDEGYFIKGNLQLKTLEKPYLISPRNQKK